MASPAPAQAPGIRTTSSPPSPRKNSMDKSSQGVVIAGLVIGFLAFLFLFTVAWSTWWGRRERRARAAAPAAGPSPHAAADDQQLRRASASSQAALLPAFAYSPSVKHNVMDDGEEATTCSVCLGAFQLGETVRLLPACLHLYHAECIDPWLDAHSTCPLCRSDTDASMDMDVAQLPPV